MHPLWGGMMLSWPGQPRGVMQAPGLSHGGGSRGTEAARGRAASPWVRPSHPAPLRLPIPFPRGQG